MIELAAIAKIDPWPLTLRQLVAAAEVRRIYDWDHTAELLAMVATHIAKKPFHRDQFHPYREYQPPQLSLDDPAKEYQRIEQLKAKRKRRK